MSEKHPARILVVDDHEIVRRGVRSLLEAKYDVCGEAVDGQDALEKARELKPSIVVMDVSMPKLNGLEATPLIRNILPDCEVLILSQHESAQMVQQAFKAGARGYVVKSSIGRDLLAALEKVSRHESFFDTSIPGLGKASRHIDAQEALQRSVALERALRESEELYRTTFQLAGVGVAHVSSDGRWVRVNQKLCDIVGYSEQELLKMAFQDVTHPVDVDTGVAAIEELRNGKLDKYSAEKRYVRKDRSTVCVNLWYRPCGMPAVR
jgi:PAS domain S-box-containing protein